MTCPVVSWLSSCRSSAGPEPPRSSSSCIQARHNYPRCCSPNRRTYRCSDCCCRCTTCSRHRENKNLRQRIIVSVRSRLLHRWTIRERMSNEYSMNGKVNKKLKKNNVGMGLVSSLEMSYAEVVRAPSLSENYASWIKAGNNDVLVLAGTGSIHIGVHVWGVCCLHHDVVWICYRPDVATKCPFQIHS